MVRDCAAVGAVLVPTIVSAAYQAVPTFGAAIAAADRAALDLATRIVHGANADLDRFAVGARG